MTLQQSTIGPPVAPAAHGLSQAWNRATVKASHVAARQAARRQIAIDVADVAAERAERTAEYPAAHEGDDWWLAYATPTATRPNGHVAWTIGEPVDDGTDDAPDDGWCGCYCRRCTLHDDCGGCTENHPPLAADPDDYWAAPHAHAGAGWSTELDEMSDADHAALMAEAYAALAEANRDTRYDLDAGDLPGWGDAFDPADVQWGFTVTAVIRGHRAPTRRPHALDPESEF